MKRDVDLCRQLLMDIENQGPHCLLTTLQCGEAPEANQRVHHHLRLLIDAGFVKETEQTRSGVPCVRLTNSGQELIELTANENRWREAKWIVQQQTGGLSLTVLMSLLTKWAVDSAACYERQQPGYDACQPYDQQAEPHVGESPSGVNPRHTEREPLTKDEFRPALSHLAGRKRFDFHNRLIDAQKRVPCETEVANEPTSVTLPASLI